MSRTLVFYGILTFILAYCSILYEFLLAQSLSAILGNTVHRFNLTIGFYIAAMGAGALVNQRLIPENLEKSLWRVEILLSMIGGVGPCLVIINFGLMNVLFQDPYFNYALSWWLTIFSHSLIIGVGFLSGLELPLLMRMASREDSQHGFKILGLDYFGTFVGAVLFPLLIFPNINLFGIGFFIASFNLLVAILLLAKHKTESQYYLRSDFILTTLLLAIFIVAFCYRSEIANFLRNDVYLHGIT